MTAHRFESELLGERYTRVHHPSGAEIYVFPKKMSSTYALFATNYGAVDTVAGDTPLPDGIAHFLEHKLFTNEDGSDSFEKFSDLGADANAYTSHTSTVYLFSCTDHFEEAFTELLTFVTHPYFTDESVEKEQGIIGEEIRMCLDNPYDRCYYQMLAGLYRDHAVRRDICGSVQSIKAITPALLYQAHKSFYTPANMVLVVVGNVTSEQVLAIADRYLKAGGSAPVRSLESKEPSSVAVARLASKGQVAKPIFSIGVKDTAIPTDPIERIKRDAAMAILNEMIFSEAGALYTKLFEGGYISPELSFEYVLTRDFAFDQIAGEADDPDAVLAIVLEHLASLSKSGFDEEELLRCRRIEYAEYIKGFDSTEEIAHNLLSFAMEGAELFSYPTVLEEIDLSYISRIFSEVFDPSHVTLSVIFPNEEDET